MHAFLQDRKAHVKCLEKKKLSLLAINLGTQPLNVSSRPKGNIRARLR
jgi:hypothetical protein